MGRPGKARQSTTPYNTGSSSGQSSSPPISSPPPTESTPLLHSYSAHTEAAESSSTAAARTAASSSSSNANPPNPMANAHSFSAGVELPNQGMAPTVGLTDHLENDIVKTSSGSYPNPVVTIDGAESIPMDAETVEGPTTGKYEEWAYYLYYNGDNGVGPIGYAATLFQSLANSAGTDQQTGQPCDANTTNCMLKFAGSTRSVPSVVLIINGIAFAIQTVLFTTIGSAADYGNLNKWILILSTIVCWASQFGMIDLWLPQHWQASAALYTIGFISYAVTLVFYASVFPRLARNTAKTKEARRQFDNHEVSAAEYERVEMLERNRISNISTAHSNWGYLITLALNLSLLLTIQNNPKVNNYVLVFTNCYWVVLGLPWFFMQKNRPGPPLPKGEHWLTIGWKQIGKAVAQYKRLPYTFVYLFSFFLLADALNTTGTLVGIVQNEHIQFSFLQSTYLGIAQAVTSISSCYAYWYIQKWKTIPTKRMFMVTNVITVLIPLWGMIGLWTKKIGYWNTWEFWAYNVVFGLGQAPYYAYSQTMMSDLTPPGYEGMFFGLFGITNRASSLIGPNVVSAIIDRSGKTRDGFIFLFILSLCAALVIWVFVDMEKGRAHAIRFAIEQRGLTGDIRADQVNEVIGEGHIHKSMGPVGKH